ALALYLNIPNLKALLHRFLYEQLHPDALVSSSDIPLSECPQFDSVIAVFHSAVATYYAPSDPCGVGGMHREHIRATPSWWSGPPWYDCVFLNIDSSAAGMHGLAVACVWLFF
ncbi:hypothetical protein EDD15DRAFT_2106569, partial [Pisolithus albus]